jgi:hypothetical protein
MDIVAAITDQQYRRNGDEHNVFDLIQELLFFLIRPCDQRGMIVNYREPPGRR